ncbi:MAG TPA: indolepyruvate oxidoreductase subunit beta family protein [Methylomirabilota bacterium]|nr:indolepyruvate oxidoreductase subunit beta family protein [Methylomirabilota bacterium]
MNDPRLLSVLIPAVGGQGGGVLLDWIVDAALLDGYPVHGTSIPGVAQRTGSTTYYVELCAERDAEPPVFSLYPVPGALDVLLAAEFLEVGRMIELGFPSPARTTIVASTHRLYSIHEKIATGYGIYPEEDLRRAARAFARELYAFDALSLAREHGTEANSVLLGALAASGALPIRADAFREAIRKKGVQVDANLRGFDAGLAAAQRLEPTAEAGAGSPGFGTPLARDPVPAPAVPAAAARSEPEVERVIAGFPDELRPTLRQAIPRLTDYQDRAYAGRYLERLRPFVALGDPELLRILARSLAVWMTYEDAIRVGQLKTRWSRFERIRREKGVGRGEIVVTDYLKPDLDEIWGILPRRLVAPFARWAERRWPRGRPTFGQHVRTTTVTGYLRVWCLALLRPLRPISYRAHEEHARMERWLAAVARCAARDRDLAREVARAAQLVKGYGDVRRRMTGHFDRLLEGVERAAEREAANGGGFEGARTLAARYRTLVLQGPDGEAEAAALAAETLAR